MRFSSINTVLVALGLLLMLSCKKDFIPTDGLEGKLTQKDIELKWAEAYSGRWFSYSMEKTYNREDNETIDTLQYMSAIYSLSVNAQNYYKNLLVSKYGDSLPSDLNSYLDSIYPLIYHEMDIKMNREYMESLFSSYKNLPVNKQNNLQKFNKTASIPDPINVTRCGIPEILRELSQRIEVPASEGAQTCKGYAWVEIQTIMYQINNQSSSTNCYDMWFQSQIAMQNFKACLLMNISDEEYKEFMDMVPPSISQPPPKGGSSGVSYFTEAEFNRLLTTLKNSINGDPIEFYLIANYKNNKSFSSSTYSIGTNSLVVGDYTLTPHYSADGTLKFYTAFRNTRLGIEYYVRADALQTFKDRYTLYEAAANAFYINGIPSLSQIQIASGDFFNGLTNSWASSISDPSYYVYLTHVLYGIGVNTFSLSPLGLGSSGGRTTANNLTELLAMKEILSNPNRGFIVPNMPPLTDPRWINWRKMQFEHVDMNGTKTVIHYNGKWENGILKAVDDFKFK